VNFTNLKSSAIKELTVKEEVVSIVFNSSDKVYNYSVIDSDFVKDLQNTIQNEESIGKFITNAIKTQKISQLVTESK
tara:strand:+ start:26 stop:256 length:231 start_codon:yes stop_codon:yes gene_type:complete